MKTNFLKGVVIISITTLALRGYSKQSAAQSSVAASGTTHKVDAASVTVTDQEIDAELDSRVAYFASIFGSTAKVEEYYGKSIAQLKKDFRNEVKMELIAAKTKRLNSGNK